MHLLLLVRHIEDVNDALLGTFRGVHVDLGEGVAVVAVEVGEGFDVVLQDGEGEIPVGILIVVKLDHFFQAFVVVDEIALEADFAEFIAYAFIDGERDGDAVFGVVHLRRGDLNVHVAVVHGVGRDRGGVALKVLFAEHARAGNP